MRSPATAETVAAVCRALGRRARSPARIYLVGGSTAVIEGWRSSTVDVDLRIEPDDQLLRELTGIKEDLSVNLELASPADFLPELPGWRERSPFLFREGLVEVFHYDLYSQALAKLERGFDRDMADVRSMVDSGAVQPERLSSLLEEITENLYRFPAVDPKSLSKAVNALVI